MTLDQFITVLLPYGGMGIAVAILLSTVIYLYKQMQGLQAKIIECHEERVTDIAKQAVALERSNAILSQLTEVEKQRSEGVDALAEIVRTRFETVMANQQMMLNNQKVGLTEIGRMVDESRRRP